jgi:hypothetical protein
MEGREEWIHRTIIRWSSRTSEEFRDFWRPVLQRVLPLFPEMGYRVLNVGVTAHRAHVVRADPQWNQKEEVMRLEPRTDRPDFMLAHELGHVVLSEKYTDLLALSRLDQSMEVGDCFYLNIKVLSREDLPYLTRLICDVAAMALHELYPETWFEARILEVGELLGVAVSMGERWDITGFRSM